MPDEGAGNGVPASAFRASGAAYDDFMGRYSRPLAALFADEAGVRDGQTVLDVGCGPGALTAELVARVGADAVAACEPSPPFVTECRARHPGVDVREARAEELPFDGDRFDAVMAQLVLHFVADPALAAAEFLRVVRPGGVLAACVWDFQDGMQLLRHVWDAALSVDPAAPDEARVLRFGRRGEIATLFRDAGCVAVTETTITVASTYASFIELWDGLLAGVGPAGAYCVALPSSAREALRADLFERLGAPTGPFTLDATARCATARRPA